MYKFAQGAYHPGGHDTKKIHKSTISTHEIRTPLRCAPSRAKSANRQDTLAWRPHLTYSADNQGQSHAATSSPVPHGIP